MRSVVFSIGLLLNIVLGAALLRLARVVLLLEIRLGLLVAGDTSGSAAHGSSDAVADARDVVVDLALSLLLLTLLVLVAAGGLESLERGKCQLKPMSTY